MKTLSSLVAVLSVISVAIAHATTIGFGPQPTARTVKDTSGVQLAVGSLVWAGSFANTSFSLNNTLSLQANVTAAMASGGWKQFGLDTSTSAPVPGRVDTLGISASGKLGGQVQDNNINVPTQADFFNNKQIYVWIFNAPSVASATQVGIFTATTATVPWVFPVNTGGVGDNQTYSSTNSGAPTITAIGGFGTAAPSLMQLTNNFNVAPVPEPTTAIFGLLTGLAAVYSRRRRK